MISVYNSISVFKWISKFHYSLLHWHFVLIKSLDHNIYFLSTFVELTRLNWKLYYVEIFNSMCFKMYRNVSIMCMIILISKFLFKNQIPYFRWIRLFKSPWSIQRAETFPNRSDSRIRILDWRWRFGGCL